MKQYARRILTAALALALMLTCLLPAMAEATPLQLDTYYDVRIGDTPEGFHLTDASQMAGAVPGMNVVAGPGGIYLEGTPSKVGVYSGTASIAFGDDNGGSQNVNVSWDLEVISDDVGDPIAPPEEPPVEPAHPDALAITKHPTTETVIEGGSATFVTRGTGYVDMQWRLVSPGGNIINIDSITARFPNVTVNNSDPTRLVLSNIPMAMHNYQVITELSNGSSRISTNGNCFIYVKEAGLDITKHPTGETVDEGGSATFVTYGTGYSYINWFLVSPDNQWINIQQAGSVFPGLSVNSSISTRLVLNNIPFALDGYRVVTILGDTKGEEVQTNGNCRISVIKAITPAELREPVEIGEPVDASGADQLPDSKAAEDGTYEIAFISEGRLRDSSYNQSTYNSLKVFADANGLSYNYYQPSHGTQCTDTNVFNSMSEAVRNGAKVIICTSTSHSNALYAAAETFPEVRFIFLDCQGNGDLNNVAGITFREEQSGFLAGYAAVMEGYRKLGFVGGGGGKNASVCRYAYGFVQGADAAAAALGTRVSLKFSWQYGSAYAPSSQLQDLTSYWYTTGTEAIFSCGGAMFNSVAAAAAKNRDAHIIGVDVDQSSQSPMVITSALKDLVTATDWALTKVYDGSWDEIGGKTTSLGAIAGAVGLPTASWSMQNFTVEQYQQLLQDIASGRVYIDPSILETNAIAFRTFSNVNIEYYA